MLCAAQLVAAALLLAAAASAPAPSSSQGAQGRALSAAAASVPACRSNEGMQGRFPTWPPTWRMQDSTIIQPCNFSGFLNASHFSQYGVVSIDWSNAKQWKDFSLEGALEAP